MKASQFRLIGVVVFVSAFLSSLYGEGKPLKVVILCGQSNMEGHAQTRTFPAIAKDPKTAGLYHEMVDAEGKAKVHEDVWVSYAYGDFSGNPVGVRSGQLTTGFGSQHHIGTGKIGPELTFGIYMNKILNEPILLIKNAWGGKSLHTDFRSPSAGPYEWTSPTDEKKKAEKLKATGRYFRLMIDHVKKVLSDPKSVYPSYDAKVGLELSGFVWFQGFNDLVGPYPKADPSQGRGAVKDYSEYSRVLSCFIRDVRTELKAPELPFVIGVLGCDGKAAKEGTVAFREAMAAPAETDEFKKTVVNVLTENFWPTEVDEVQAKIKSIYSEKKKKENAIKKKELSREEKKKAYGDIGVETRAKIEEVLSEDELFTLDNGISNRGYHYHGSAKFFAQIGKAFAEALLKVED